MPRIAWGLVSLAWACGGSEYSAACQQGCEEYIESDQDAKTCAAELRECISACEEVTAKAEGACAACLTSDGLEGPYLDEGLCELGYFDPQYCKESC
jgi:hypothetical protein